MITLEAAVELRGVSNILSTLIQKQWTKYQPASITPASITRDNSSALQTAEQAAYAATTPEINCKELKKVVH